MLRSTMLLLVSACGWVAVSAHAAPPAGAQAAPYSAHSMVHSCCTPFAQKERMFSEAKAMGARYIRLDIALDEVFDVWTVEAPEPQWRGIDEIIRLSRRYRLRVLAVMIGTPAHISTCRERWPEGHGRCAATDPPRFGEYAARVVARAPDVFRTIEVWNEPDGAWAFDGTPEQYADMLMATHAAVTRRFPAVTVLIGGAMSMRSRDWYARVLATGAVQSFDVANVHIRGRAASLRPAIRRWRRFFRDHGHRGPLWVTETGYPSEARSQYDERYGDGEPAQARYIRAALPALVRAGAEQVFVTMRDGWTSEFGTDSAYTSEGVLEMAEDSPFTIRRKAAFGAVRRLAASARRRGSGRGRRRAGDPRARRTSMRSPARSSSLGSRSGPA